MYTAETQSLLLTITFCFYFVNAILLLCHEIESAYWKEWELFKLKGGITFFILIHIPIIALIFYGLIALYLEHIVGLILSIVLCLGGLFAFSIHTYFIKKGKEEFSLPISKFLLVGLLCLSIVQLILTFIALFAPIVSSCC